MSRFALEEIIHVLYKRDSYRSHLHAWLVAFRSLVTRDAPLSSEALRQDLVDDWWGRRSSFCSSHQQKETKVPRPWSFSSLTVNWFPVLSGVELFGGRFRWQTIRINGLAINLIGTQSRSIHPKIGVASHSQQKFGLGKRQNSGSFLLATRHCYHTIPTTDMTDLANKPNGTGAALRFWHHVAHHIFQLDPERSTIPILTS